MPYILPVENSSNSNITNAFERFNQIVETYKHIIENNATARCMVGFTAASFIQNEGDIDIDSVESWLQSLESDSQPCLEEPDHNNTKVNRILSVVKETSAQHYYQEYEDEEDLTTDDSEDNEDEFNDETSYELNRFISCDPYSADSYPIYNYIPKYTFVNYSAGNVPDHSETTLC